MHYTKQAVSIPDQLAMLKERGLAIGDETAAVRHLHNISYYRLAGYLLPLQDDKTAHTYKPGSSFEKAMGLYQFDQKLRVLLFDVIERIEVYPSRTALRMDCCKSTKFAS